MRYDAIVVGSGPGGAMSAHTLANQGLKVLLLEAGRDYDPTSETPMFSLPAEAPLLGAATPDKPMGYFDATVDGGWQVPGEPYTVAEGSDFTWWRARMLGGRANHWNRICLRFGPYDFQPYSRDGLGFDWPIRYEDLAASYDAVEQLIGVTGQAEGIENSPDSPEGTLLPPPPMRASEYFLKRGFESMGIRVAANHTAILTRPHNGRPACVYATPCHRGCALGANFQTPTVLLPPALATGNLEIRTNAMVHRVDVDATGRATGVHFHDRLTNAEEVVAGRIVVLAASSCETARILLNSRSGTFPNGIGNNYRMVGRYLMDSVSAGTYARLPALEALPPRNDDGISTCHIYVPWWGHPLQAAGKLDFPRGYHVEMASGRTLPEFGAVNPDFCTVKYGLALREELRRQFGTFVYLAGHGEMIPNEHSYCALDHVQRDKWGVPVLRFNWAWSDHEYRQVTHMRQTFVELFRRLGGNVLFGGETDGRSAILPGGAMIHEVGGVRMGADPTTSVVNSNGQCWTTPNLFVADGGVFVSNPEKNPTLTIMALSRRTSLSAAEQIKSGAL